MQPPTLKTPPLGRLGRGGYRSRVSYFYTPVMPTPNGSFVHPNVIFWRPKVIFCLPRCRVVAPQRPTAIPACGLPMGWRGGGIGGVPHSVNAHPRPAQGERVFTEFGKYPPLWAGWGSPPISTKRLLGRCFLNCFTKVPGTMYLVPGTVGWYLIPGASQVQYITV
jgi:hypothetical protein